MSDGILTANDTLDPKSMTAMLGVLFDDNPDGIVIADTSGRITCNPVAIAAIGAPDPDVSPEEWSERYGLFHEDQQTRFPPNADPLALAMQGQVVSDVIMFSRNPNKPEGIFVSVSARPLANGGAIAVFRDVTERRRMADDLAQRNAELALREQENRELIARLRVAVDELSTPVLEIWNDVLALPVVGIVDTQRSARMTERLLAEVVRTRCRSVIVDLTGVELIDTSTADRFIKLARSVQLLGSRCLVTGIQPAVAQTLVELGVEFSALETHRNLKSALEASIRRDVAERRAHQER
ncbi:MAG: STAS domain-containing protein [Myxococcales bacterium]